MAEALAQARLAEAKGETPVGAVLVTGNGRIAGVGHNASESLRDPTAHAEIAALRAAALVERNYRLEGGVLVVTLEPCLMCAGALVHARVAGLVYGAPDPKAGAVDSRLDCLEQAFCNHRVWSLGGVCREECAALLRAFFTRRRPAAPALTSASSSE
jgi:tRNA(adenine34) deaminase